MIPGLAAVFYLKLFQLVKIYYLTEIQVSGKIQPEQPLRFFCHTSNRYTALTALNL
jgi:hypothetical protein